MILAEQEPLGPASGGTDRQAEPDLNVASRSPGPPVEEQAAVSAEANEGFLSTRPPRSGSESVLVRVVATVGVIAIGTALGAILVANNVAGWIASLVVATVSVALAAVLWRSRRL
jgi:hypothetical protein